MGAARSIGSATLVIRHVRVPLKLFTAASAKRVSFNTLHKCGSRIESGLRCKTEDKPIERSDTVQAFEYQPDRFVEFPKAETDAIKESLGDKIIELAEFVPESSIGITAVEKACFLGPDKGCEADYAVITRALARRRLAGVGYWGADLVVVRAMDGGLVAHVAYYASEVRSLGDAVDELGAAPLEHVKLAENLFTLMGRESFDAGRFTDRYAEKIAEAVKRKIDGKKVIIPPPPTGAQPLGLLEALERSVAGGPVKVGARRKGKAA